MQKGEHNGRRVNGGRGLYDFGRVRAMGDVMVTVRRSSLATEEAAWVLVKDAEGREVVPCVGAPGGMAAVGVLLTKTQARRLADALLRFAGSQ